MEVEDNSPMHSFTEIDEFFEGCTILISVQMYVHTNQLFQHMATTDVLRPIPGGHILQFEMEVEKYRVDLLPICRISQMSHP